MPRSFKEICAVLPEVNRKDIGRAFTAIKNLLQASLPGLAPLAHASPTS
jgi:hypothetical protein